MTWFCRHKWKRTGEVLSISQYRRVQNDWIVTGYRIAQECEKCGKLQFVKTSVYA